MCSRSVESFLDGFPVSKLETFSWDDVCRDLAVHAPTLAYPLSCCAQTADP